jgi:predicted oxidoreductase
MADWALDAAGRLRWIEQCLDLGITSFDHADIYGDYTVESLFGEALAAAPALRERLQLVTKCGIKLTSPRRPAHAIKSYDTSAAHVVASVDASLRALRTDRIDLLLIHRPDALMDPDELAGTFRQLQADGKVLHVGVSNHAPSQFALLHRRIPLSTNQVELSPLRLDVLADGTLDQALDLGVRPMIWSPLAGGRIFADGDAAADRVRVALEEVGARHGVSPTTAAFAWILRHPSRPVPITGSGRLEALREAVAALEVTITREEWYRIWRAGAGREIA